MFGDNDDSDSDSDNTGSTGKPLHPSAMRYKPHIDQLMQAAVEIHNLGDTETDPDAKSRMQHFAAMVLMCMEQQANPATSRGCISVLNAVRRSQEQSDADGTDTLELTALSFGGESPLSPHYGFLVIGGSKANPAPDLNTPDGQQAVLNAIMGGAMMAQLHARFEG
jgi:hypothetical protein